MNDTIIQIDAGTLEFSAEDLTATGLLIPFGVECSSNLGRFAVDSGAFTYPADLTGMGLNVEHSREHPVAAIARLWDTDAGTMATFKFADTDEGRAAFADKSRRHLSAEVANVIIRAGKAVSGRVFGAAKVERPAFPGATLLAAAADTVEIAPGVEVPAHTEATSSSSNTASDGSAYDSETTETEDIEDLGDGTQRITRTVTTVTTVTDPTTQQEVNPVGDNTASIPATLTASHAAPKAPEGMSLKRLSSILAEACRTQDRTLLAALHDEGVEGATLYAALTDIKGSQAAAMIQPQWIGEAWGLRTFDRIYVPLFAHADLTSFTVSGFKWTTPPVMAPWNGEKVAIPSSPVQIDPTSATAKGWATANDIDRRLRDFTVPEFWDGYFRHTANSYSKLSDTDAIASVVAGATPVTAGVKPAGISQAAVSIVDGALAVMDQGVPSFAVVEKALWRDLLLTPKDQTLEYLSMALGLAEGDLEGFRILPARTGDLAAGKTLVGIGAAATVYELPGSPIRVEGLDMVKGGIDPGAFGYALTQVEESKAFALVTPAP
jgi:hypothetical protein